MREADSGLVRKLDCAAYLTWLHTECGYRDVRLLPTGKWAAVNRLMYHGSILTGRIGDLIRYDDRWCYASVQAAREALEAWDGTGEPVGWHRHPATGRRVDEQGRLYRAW